MGLKIGLGYHFGCHQASPQNDTLSLGQPPIKWFPSGQPETITWGNPPKLLYRWPKKLWGFLELRKFKNRYLALETTKNEDVEGQVVGYPPKG